MVKVYLESDQAGYEAPIGKDGSETENGDPQENEKGWTLVDQGKR